MELNLTSVVVSAFIAVAAYFLKRTGESLDRVEQRVHDHEVRITVMEKGASRDS